MLPAALGVAAFVVVDQVALRHGGSLADGSHAVNQPIRALADRTVPLQVAVHDLIEVAPSPTTIRVCRSLASQSVTMHVAGSEPMSKVLRDLASQVGGEVVLATESPRSPALPTILCPGGRSGDYLNIGFSQRGR